MATPPTFTAISVGTFDNWSPRYKCCCGCCHVRCASFAIGLLQTMGLGSLFINLIIAVSNFDKDVTFADYGPLIISSLVFSYCTFCVICLFIGLCKGKPLFLTPMLFMLLISIGYYLFMVIFVIIVFASDSDVLTNFLSHQLRMHGSSFYDKGQIKEWMKPSMIIMIITFSIGAIFDFWWYRVIRTCRTYLKDKQDWNLHHTVPESQHYHPATGDVTVNLLPPTTSSGGTSGQPGGSFSETQFSGPPPTYNEVIGGAKAPL